MRISDGDFHSDHEPPRGGEAVEVGAADGDRADGDQAQVLADRRQQQDEEVQEEELGVEACRSAAAAP